MDAVVLITLLLMSYRQPKSTGWNHILAQNGKQITNEILLMKDLKKRIMGFIYDEENRMDYVAISN